MEQRITGRNSYGLGAQGVMLCTRYRRRSVHMLYVTQMYEDISRKTRVLIAYKHHFNKHRTCILNPPTGASDRPKNNVL